MASNTTFSFGPVLLTTTTTTNILNPGTTTGGVNCTGSPYDKLYLILKYLRVMNQTLSPVSFALWLGSTGTNSTSACFAFPGIASGAALTNGVSVPATNFVDWYGIRRVSQADFLVGGAGTATALVIIGGGEIGIGA